GGGTAIVFDVDRVTEVHAAGGRLMHLANTIAGMSGSCCVGPRGLPVGLHEGGFYKLDENGKVVVNEKLQPVVEKNRAVCLSNIPDALRAMQPDPLMIKRAASGGGIYDPDLVVDWHRAGQRFAGKDLEAGWNASVAHVLGVSLADIGAAQSFHPWFSRKDI